MTYSEMIEMRGGEFEIARGERVKFYARTPTHNQRDWWVELPSGRLVARISTAHRNRTNPEYRGWAEQLVAMLPTATFQEIRQWVKLEPVQ